VETAVERLIGSSNLRSNVPAVDRAILAHRLQRRRGSRHRLQSRSTWFSAPDLRVRLAPEGLGALTAGRVVVAHQGAHRAGRRHRTRSAGVDGLLPDRGAFTGGRRIACKPDVGQVDWPAEVTISV